MIKPINIKTKKLQIVSLSAIFMIVALSLLMFFGFNAFAGEPQKETDSLAFNEATAITNATDLRNSITNGGEYYLKNDIQIGDLEQIEVEGNFAYSLNMNGHSIMATYRNSAQFSKGAVFSLKKFENVEIYNSSNAESSFSNFNTLESIFYFEHCKSITFVDVYFQNNLFTGTKEGNQVRNSLINILSDRTDADALVTFKGCMFSECESFSEEKYSEEGKVAGAINMVGGKLDITGNPEKTTFSNCKGDLGGALSLKAYFDKEKKENNFFKLLTTKDVSFDSCYANLRGGAIYIETGHAEINGNVSETTFKECQANFNGGAICCGNTNKTNINGVLLNNVSFDSCSAKYGGAVYSSYNDYVEFDYSCQIDKCSASEQGGAIWVNSTHLVVDDTTIKNCYVDNKDDSMNTYGGLVYARKSQCYFLSTKIDDCGILSSSNNFSYGGVFYGCEFTYVSFNKSSINCDGLNSSYGTDYGGAFAIDNGYIMMKDNSEIINCKANIFGGAIYNNSTCYKPDKQHVSKGESYIQDSTIDNCHVIGSSKYEHDPNTHGPSGGAIYLVDQKAVEDEKDKSIVPMYCHFDLQNVTISNCSAFYDEPDNEDVNDSCGGAVFAYGMYDSTNLNVVHSTISGCKSDLGGGIYAHDCVVNFKNNTKITECIATDYAGGVAVGKYETTVNPITTISDGLIVENCSAGIDGGGFYAYMDVHVSGTINISTNKVKENSSNLVFEFMPWQKTSKNLPKIVLDSALKDTTIGVSVPIEIPYTSRQNYINDDDQYTITQNFKTYNPNDEAVDFFFSDVADYSIVRDTNGDVVIRSGNTPKITIDNIPDQKYSTKKNVDVNVNFVNFTTKPSNVKVYIYNSWNGMEKSFTSTSVTGGKINVDLSNIVPGKYTLVVVAADSGESYYGTKQFNITEGGGEEKTISTGIWFYNVGPEPGPVPPDPPIPPDPPGPTPPEPEPVPVPVVDPTIQPGADTGDITLIMLTLIFALLGCSCIVLFVFGPKFNYVYNKQLSAKHIEINNLINNRKVLAIVGAVFITISLILTIVLSVNKASAQENNHDVQVNNLNTTYINQFESEEVTASPVVLAFVDTDYYNVGIQDGYIKNNTSDAITLNSVQVLEMFPSGFNWKITAGNVTLYDSKSGQSSETELSIAPGATQKIEYSSDMNSFYASFIEGFGARVFFTFDQGGGSGDYDLNTITGSLTINNDTAHGHSYTVSGDEVIKVAINNNSQTLEVKPNDDGTFVIEDIKYGSDVNISFNKSGYYGENNIKVLPLSSNAEYAVNIEAKGPHFDNYTLEEIKAIAEDISTSKGASVYYDEFSDYIGSVEEENGNHTEEIWYSHSCGKYNEQTPDASVLDKKYKNNFESSNEIDDYLFLRIIGINEDDITNGSGKKAGLTLQTVHCLPRTYAFSEYAWEYEEPSGPDGPGFSYYWGQKDKLALRNRLNTYNGTPGDIYSLFNPLFTANMLAVDKKTQKNRNDKTGNSIETTSDKLFLLSYSEMNGKFEYYEYYKKDEEIPLYKYEDYDAYKGGEGKAYSWFFKHKITGKQISEGNNPNEILMQMQNTNSGKEFGYPNACWLRSCCIKHHKAKSQKMSMLTVGFHGSIYNPGDSSNQQKSICPAFCF